MIDISNQLWLAPLAGVTDNIYRRICKKWGADWVVSEMVSADGLHYSPQHTLPYAVCTDDQRPYAIQIFGSDPEMMARGARIVAELKPDMIDINMGCPVKKVIKRNAGSALMKDIELAGRIIVSVKAVCEEYGLPLSVKFRAGWDMDSINVVEFAQMAENAGADLVIVHPRTRSQMFSGKSDWQLIKAVKQAVSVPVIGNGDIFTVEDAAEMQKLTGCDSVMIGRGIMGKPWLFKQIKIFQETGNLWEPQPEEVLETITEHFRAKLESSRNGILEMRPHLSAYTKGYRGSARIRELINRTTDVEEILGAIEKLIFSE